MGTTEPVVQCSWGSCALLCSNVYFKKNISADYMHNVLVLTLPPANYSYNTVIRDYVEMDDDILVRTLFYI